jgi:2-dehydropantoate 2-reductase
MWKDIKEGRQTENDAISGYLLQHAKMDIPYTAFVYHSIKTLETKAVAD